MCAEYMARTRPLHQTQSLFITSTGRHQAAALGTLAGWIKGELQRAGIDTAVYSAHSTRAATTSKAAGTLPVERVLAAADWASAHTFARHYEKEVESHGDFMEAVWQCHSC